MAPPPDDGIDRAAILRRRSLFVVSAMSSVATATLAHAQAPPEAAAPECPPKEPSPEDLQVAAEAFVAGKKASEHGDFAEAATAFERAYNHAPKPKILTLWMQALFRSGAPEAAAQAAIRHVLCGGDRSDIQETLADIQSKSAKVVFSITGPGAEAVTLTIDEQPVDLARARLGVLVTAGAHRVSLATSTRRTTASQFVATPGQSMTVDLVAPANTPPEPCLNIVRHSSVSHRIRLGAGVIAPFFSVAPSGPPSVLAGAGLRAAITARAAGSSDREGFFIDGDVFSTFSGDETVRLVMLGGDLELLYMPERVYSFGLGFGAGYLFDLTSDAGPPDYYLSSVFFGPVLTPLCARVGPVEMKLRVPIWFAETRSEGVKAFRTVMVAPYATFTLGAGAGSEN